MNGNAVIGDFMTKQPYTIEDNKTVGEAQELMRTHNIRHLPVTVDGKVHGILSDRDVKSILGLMPGSAKTMRVKYVCHEHPFHVESKVLLSQVVHEMAIHHYGCVIVTHLGELAGIFTTVDVCRVFSEFLNHTQQ